MHVKPVLRIEVMHVYRKKLATLTFCKVGFISAVQVNQFLASFKLIPILSINILIYWLLTLGTANVYKNNLSVQACPSLSIKAVFSPFKCLYSSKHPKICPYLSRDQIILKYHPLLVQEKSRLVQSFPEKELNFHIMANQGQTYCLLSTFNYCVA